MKQHQQQIRWITMLFVLLALSACTFGTQTNMSDDEKEIAIAVALTQTAAAIESTASVAEASTPEPIVGEEESTVESAEEEIPTVEPTVTPESVEPTATPISETPPTTIPPTPTVEVIAGGTEDDGDADSLPVDQVSVDQLRVDQLPITQNSLMARSLLVAPGEPGALYVLLTDADRSIQAATGARFLVSRDFGRNWEPSPSGLPPVEESCLVNIHMDYYGDTALYASTCQGIYRWAPSDADWALISSQQTEMVAIVYGNDNILWAGRANPYTAEGAPVLLSQNGGTSWSEIRMAQFKGPTTIGISPRDSQSGYAIIQPESYPGRYLLRGSMFTDWQTMPTPGDNIVINGGMTIDGGTGWLYVTTMEADGDRLWRSFDADTPILEDVNWEEVYRFAPGMTVELLASGWSSEEGKLAIYANIRTETSDGQSRYTFVRSLDSGKSWAPLVVDAG